MARRGANLTALDFYLPNNILKTPVPPGSAVFVLHNAATAGTKTENTRTGMNGAE